MLEYGGKTTTFRNYVLELTTAHAIRISPFPQTRNDIV